MGLLPLDRPLNSEERYLFGISERLDMIVDLLQQMIVQESKIEKAEPKKKKR